MNFGLAALPKATTPFIYLYPNTKQIIRQENCLTMQGNLLQSKSGYQLLENGFS